MKKMYANKCILALHSQVHNKLAIKLLLSVVVGRLRLLEANCIAITRTKCRYRSNWQSEFVDITICLMKGMGKRTILNCPFSRKILIFQSRNEFCNW